MADAVDRVAQDIADKAGPLYSWSGRQGKSRYRAIVFPKSYLGRVDNARHNTLLKALGS